MLKPVAAIYDEQAQHFDTHPKHQDAIHRMEDEAIEKLTRGLVHGKSVLDLCCGTGHLLDRNASSPPRRYVGLDISEGMLRRAREKYPTQCFVYADVENFRPGDLPDPRIVFDSVVSLFALAYVARIDKLFENVRQVSRPGTEAFFWLYTPEYMRRASYGFRKGHVPRYYYTPEEWALAAEGSGFHLTRHRVYSHIKTGVRNHQPKWLNQAIFDVENSVSWYAPAMYYCDTYAFTCKE